MPDPVKLVRIPSLKTPAAFREQVAALGIELPCEDEIAVGASSPLAQPLQSPWINGKRIGNRLAVHPMEGWDGTTDGRTTEDVKRRWKRFGETGAKLIYGGEAMAVRADGRANPNQLIIAERTEGDLAEIRNILLQAHGERYGATDDLAVGFQLTHSGRFCKPEANQPRPRVAYRHPLLDARFGVVSDAQVLTDGEVEELVDCYARAARVAWNAGADFVDIKHCHGYLLHEFLSARTRAGKYGGCFENRTRVLREIVQAIRSSGNRIDLAVRLSAFDTVPFKPDSALSQPGKPGPGVPEDIGLPYTFAFGANPDRPRTVDLSETYQFAELCASLGIKLLNLSGGSPYYNPHIQRPAAYPPSDGYQPPEDPLVGVARQISVVRDVRQFLDTLPGSAAAGIVVIGSAYSYLQEYLPHVAQYVIRNRWTDMVGLGRMVLSYPRVLADAMESGSLNTKMICRTFSDCTTAPRNGLISGCYPLDKYYATKPEAMELRRLKGERKAG